MAPLWPPTGQRPHILHFVPQPMPGSSLSVSVCRTLVRLCCNKKRPGQASKDLYSGPHRASYQSCDFRGVTCLWGLTLPSCEMRRFNLICLRVPSSSICSTTSKALGHPFPAFLPFSSPFLSFSQPTDMSYHVSDPMPEAGNSGQSKQRPKKGNLSICWFTDCKCVYSILTWKLLPQYPCWLCSSCYSQRYAWEK